jgi:transposase
MQLKDDDLRQIDDARLERLREGDLRTLSKKMLADLKEARERLKQSPKNSSRPPSSQAPWEKSDEAAEDAADSASTAEADEEDTQASADPEDDSDEDEPAPKSSPKDEQEGEKPARRPSRVKGMPGYGRTQRLAITDTVHHHPETCALCSRELRADGGVWTSFETIDIEVGASEAPGIHVTNTRHVYHEATCACGHTTRARPHRADDDPLWEKVALSEWRLAGPTLCALVIAVTFRSRMSRPRAREASLRLRRSPARQAATAGGPLPAAAAPTHFHLPGRPVRP